ncbi:putative BURP domain-containing protein [Medicago truncatula]|uniref:Putative BURP domain-containing protein n=1 Tax=Medicago truncatula TaxID=3880 RepID=A0A396GGZ4_MEDTR|nr:putative BURP domain-containing protein [Medicago truncatula]
MEFTRLFVFVLFCLTLLGINEAQSGKEYWKSIWPNTPMPQAVLDLLQPESRTNLPIRGEENKQYWTVFFDHDLYPGNKISLGIRKNYDAKPKHLGAPTWSKKESQPYEAHTRGEKRSEDISQPFGAWKSSEKTNEEISQPFGAWKSSEKTNEEISQPFGAWKSTWKSSEKTNEEISQPFGAWKSSEKTNEEISQPFGAWKSSEKTNEEISQPFGAWKSSVKPKLSQPFGAWKSSEKTRTRTQGEKTSEEISKPYRASTEGEKISLPFETRTWGVKERKSYVDYCGHPSAIGEDKYCALSLKSMMNFAISKLGTNIKVITSSFAQNQDQYRVDEVKKIGDNAVLCHRMNFKNIIFSCHQVNATTVYMVPLVASDGTKAKAVTICHHDTRGMNPDHLYKVLKVKPGTVPICHFIGNKAIAWVPNNVVDESVDHPCVI